MNVLYGRSRSAFVHVWGQKQKAGRKMMLIIIIIIIIIDI